MDSIVLTHASLIRSFKFLRKISGVRINYEKPKFSVDQICVAIYMWDIKKKR